MICQGIDGQVASGAVFTQIRCKDNGIGVAVIAVARVGAVCSDLNRHSVDHNRNGAVGNACINNRKTAEYGVHLFGKGIGGQIIVMHKLMQKRITDSPAHNKTLKACL